MIFRRNAPPLVCIPKTGFTVGELGKFKKKLCMRSIYLSIYGSSCLYVKICIQSTHTKIVYMN